VLDRLAVIEGILPKDGLDELCMIITIWLDERCGTDENLDRKDLYRSRVPSRA
jgi:5,6,7,8-tetrahydromethanopterin hydro-lyase